MDKVIELKKVSKRFGKNEVYRDMNMEIYAGECVGIVGANGSGKSVLFQIISGLMQADDGEVRVNGMLLGKDCDFPGDVGILINAPGYVEYYSGFKNLKLLAQIQDKIDDEKIRDTMRLVGLDPEDRTLVKKFSMGMKQKLGIAQAIMEDQKIVILDEPYNSLDYTTNKEITNILKQLKKEGKTVLLTSHQHDYLDKLCDRMYYIENLALEVFDERKKEEYFTV